DVDERFSIVAVRIEAGAYEGARRLETQHRNLAHAATVGGRGEEAEEAIFAGEIAALVVALDADAIERHVAMHGAASVGLGDDEQVFGSRVLAELAAHRRGRARGRFGADVAQDAEAASRNRREVVVVVTRFESVAAEP